jgi:membrane associated rhomboid family serine protease
MPGAPYASPVSSLTDTAERAVANARFSSVGRRIAAGPNLPLPLDLETHAPEIALVTWQALGVVRGVLERNGGVIPPATLSLVLLNAGVFLKPGGVWFGDVCLNPYAVLHMNQLDRVVKSAFVHRDLFHLVGNMSSLAQDGSDLESIEGSRAFLKRVILALTLSQFTLVGLSSLERKLRGRGGAGALDRWLADAGKAFDRNFGLDTDSNGVPITLTGGYGRRPRNPATLPFYTSGVIGFSGVNYALKVAACDKKPRDRVALVFGLVPVPARFAFWADLCVNTLISPSSGTFAAHFAGCLAGLITVYAPKMVRGGARARGARAQARRSLPPRRRAGGGRRAAAGLEGLFRLSPFRKPRHRSRTSSRNARRNAKRNECELYYVARASYLWANGRNAARYDAQREDVFREASVVSDFRAAARRGGRRAPRRARRVRGGVRAAAADHGEARAGGDTQHQGRAHAAPSARAEPHGGVGGARVKTK